MQANEFYIVFAFNGVYNLVELLIVYTKLVLGKAGGYIGVGVCADVGVYTYCDLRHHPTLRCQCIYGIYFGDGFHVKTEDAGIERKGYLFIGFSHTCKYYVSGRNSGLKRSGNLATAHAIGPKTARCYYSEQAGVEIGLYGIVHVETIVFCSLPLHGVYCLFKKLDIVIIEGGFNMGESLYWKLCFHQKKISFS